MWIHVAVWFELVYGVECRDELAMALFMSGGWCQG
jgi:hypothetical protein